jgi:hypothetical protein
VASKKSFNIALAARCQGVFCPLLNLSGASFAHQISSWNALACPDDQPKIMLKNSRGITSNDDI